MAFGLLTRRHSRQADACCPEACLRASCEGKRLSLSAIVWLIQALKIRGASRIDATAAARPAGRMAEAGRPALAFALRCAQSPFRLRRDWA